MPDWLGGLSAPEMLLLARGDRPPVIDDEPLQAPVVDLHRYEYGEPGLTVLDDCLEHIGSARLEALRIDWRAYVVMGTDTDVIYDVTLAQDRTEGDARWTARLLTVDWLTMRRLLVPMSGAHVPEALVVTFTGPEGRPAVIATAVVTRQRPTDFGVRFTLGLAERVRAHLLMSLAIARPGGPDARIGAQLAETAARAIPGLDRMEDEP